MMTVKALEWGYDDSGKAVGPVQNAAYTEIKFCDGEGKEWYVLASRYKEDEQIYVSSAPAIATAFAMMHGEISEEEGKAKILSASEETYAYELPNIPAEMESSRFYQAIKLTCKALHEVSKIGMFPDRISADKFIGDFLEQDCDAIFVQPIPEQEDVVQRFM